MGSLDGLVAGFGCRPGCPPAELHALLQRALGLANAATADLVGIATLTQRLHAPALTALAASLGLPLAGYGAAALLPFEPWLSHRSEISWRHVGCHGVAESAALAHCSALSASPARLAVTRLCSAAATVALAARAST